MARKLTMGLNWQGKLDFKALIDRVEDRRRGGHPFDVGGARRGATMRFTLLALLAEHTKKIQLGTSIVNIYSRTPAALAQHFGTLDELSGGRMIIGLGTSGPQVIEHFHGIKFDPPLTRLKEYVDIINMIMAGTPLNYNGKLFELRTRIHDSLRADPQAHPDFHCVAESEERRVHRERSVTGDLFTTSRPRLRIEGDFVLPPGETLDANVIATGEFHIGRGARLLGSAKSYRDTVIDEDACVHGSIVCGGTVWLGPRTFATGPVMAESDVLIARGARVG